MKKPNPELIDDENPEWTEETFANAMQFSSLPPDLQELLNSPKRVMSKRDAAPRKTLNDLARAEMDEGLYDRVLNPSIPLSPEIRAAYQDLYNKIQAAIESTIDANLIETLNSQMCEIDQVLTKDDEYKLSGDTAVFAALKTQIESTNQGLNTLRTEVVLVASHFASARAVLRAIDKVLALKSAA